MFIIMAIGVGIIARMSADEIAKGFLKGCSQLVIGAFIVGRRVPSRSFSNRA